MPKNQALEAALNEVDRLNATRTRLFLAAKDVLDQKQCTFRARNGRDVGIEDERGEKMWIVPFEAMEMLAAAVEADDISPPPQPKSEINL